MFVLCSKLSVPYTHHIVTSLFRQPCMQPSRASSHHVLAHL